VEDDVRAELRDKQASRSNLIAERPVPKNSRTLRPLIPLGHARLWYRHDQLKHLLALAFSACTTAGRALSGTAASRTLPCLCLSGPLRSRTFHRIRQAVLSASISARASAVNSAKFNPAFAAEHFIA